MTLLYAAIKRRNCGNYSSEKLPERKKHTTKTEVYYAPFNQVYRISMDNRTD
jgi:hypothetical protein